MMNKITKKIIKFLLLFSIGIFPFANTPQNAFAGTSDKKGVLYIRADYSETIHPHDDDMFVFSLQNENGKQITIKLNLSEYTQNYYKQDLEPGLYTVEEMEYQGTNDKVEKEGYAIHSKVEVGKEDKYMLVGVGHAAALSMQDIYENVLVRIQGGYTNDLEKSLLEFENIKNKEETEKDTEIEKETKTEESDPIETTKETEEINTETKSSIKETELQKNTLADNEKPNVEDFRDEKKAENASLAMTMFWNTLPLVILSIIFAIVLVILKKIGKLQ